MIRKYVKISAVTALMVFPSIAAADSGIVVLADSGCDRFVVQTDYGFSLLERRGGYPRPRENDEIYGELTSYGSEEVYIKHGGEIRVYIDSYWASEDDAMVFFYEECAN